MAPEECYTGQTALRVAMAIAICMSNDGTPLWCSQPEIVVSDVQRARGLNVIPWAVSLGLMAP